MQKKYSARVESLSSSITIAISTKARELKAAGEDVLSFSAGEPDFDTPKAIKEAAISAINNGFTKYTAVPGIPELLSAVGDKLRRENGLDYKNNEIVVNCGAKHSLFAVFSALIENGDEVIIPAPYWVTYPELVKYCGGKSVFLETSEKSDFKITPKQLKEALNPRTKILVLTTPSNPTGMVYSREELQEIGEVLKGSNCWVVSDEIYEKLIYDGKFTSAGAVSEDMFNRTITINGLSKSVAMTGWRMGYVAAHDERLIKLISNLQSQSVSNINSITQKASIVALNGSVDSDIEKMRAAFAERLEYAHKAFNEIKGLSVAKPQGAFYLFVNCSAIQKDSMKFANDLLEKQKVAVVPGIGFGLDGYFRFSFASDLESIKRGIERIAAFCS